MYNPNRSPRPRLTARIAWFAALDAFGMYVLAIGIAFLTRGPGVFFRNFPSSTLEALVVSVAGAALMLWSGAHILKEIGRQQMGDPPPGA